MSSNNTLVWANLWDSLFEQFALANQNYSYTRHQYGGVAEAHMRKTEAEERGDILWYVLDDVVNGHASGLAEAEVVINALRKNRPPPDRRLTDIVRIMHAFRNLDPESRNTLLGALNALEASG